MSTLADPRPSVAALRRTGASLFRRTLPVARGVALSLLSGLLLALSYPPGRLPFLAWVALVPVLFALFGARRRWALLHGALCGLVFSLLAFHWLRVFHLYAPLVSFFVSGFCFVALPLAAFRLLPRGRLVLPFAAAAVWIVSEFVKQSWFLRFPFGVLGYTQYTWLPYIQVAEVGGVLAVSGLIVLVNGALFRLAALLLERRPLRARLRPLAVTAALLLLAFLGPLAYGWARLSALVYEEEPRLKVGFAQTLFHPRAVWREHEEEYLGKIRESVAGLAGLKVKLVLFPELTLNRPLSFDPSIDLPGNARILNDLSAMSRENGVHLLLGSLELKRDGGRVRTYNSMYLFSPAGDLAGLYRKRVPVPFGEVDPFGGLIPGFGAYIRGSTDAVALDAGPAPYLFTVEDTRGEPLRFGVLTCFESGLPALARGYARQGAAFLINASDDYWSRSAAAAVQHAVMSVFRAIETRRPLLRISNGGISGYIDERGRAVSRIPLFRSGAMTSQLHLLRDPPSTLYVRFGDWVVPLSLAGLAVLAGRSPARRLSARLRRRSGGRIMGA